VVPRIPANSARPEEPAERLVSMRRVWLILLLTLKRVEFVDVDAGLVAEQKQNSQTVDSAAVNIDQNKKQIPDLHVVQCDHEIHV
jgi:hypothetical protein